MNRVAPALVESGGYDHAALEIRTIDVSPTVAAANGLGSPGGVLVVDVLTDDSALRACDRHEPVRGREVPVGGDVIVGVDGHRIDSHEELTRYLVTETSPGDTIEMAVSRDGASRDVTVTLATRPRLAARGRHIPIEGS